MNRWIEDQWEMFVRKSLTGTVDGKTLNAMKKVYFAGARDGVNLTMVAERKVLMDEITLFAEQVNAPQSH